MEKAYLLISCEVGTEGEVISAMQKIDSIKNVSVTYGNYDIVAEVVSDTPSKMDEIITSKIRKLEKIRSTITLRVTT